MPLIISEALVVPDEDFEWKFIRASGPGGQNVNKVSSAVQLRFNAAASPALSEPVLLRLRRVAGRRMTADGVIVLTAARFRDQLRNRVDALERLVEMIREASLAPKPRRPTKPTYGSKQRRLETKSRRSQVKVLRGRPLD